MKQHRIIYSIHFFIGTREILLFRSNIFRCLLVKHLLTPMSVAEKSCGAFYCLQDKDINLISANGWVTKSYGSSSLNIITITFQRSARIRGITIKSRRLWLRTSWEVSFPQFSEACALKDQMVGIFLILHSKK